VHGPQTRVSDGARSSSTHARWRWLLDAVGAADPLVAAGLLNDAVERTATTPSDLTLRFGDEVAMPVAAVTGQRSMRRYRKRKAALRERATTSGEPAAILFAADKIAKVRQYRQQLEQSVHGCAPPRRRRLHHYTESLLSLEAVIRHPPLVRTLRRELSPLTPLPARPEVVTVLRTGSDAALSTDS